MLVLHWLLHESGLASRRRGVLYRRGSLGLISSESSAGSNLQ